ncbi:hypothetical protein A2U01_0035928, partial [Trifolium medium]|nr:hypothetical protein [Trifolium medium]
KPPFKGKHYHKRKVSDLDSISRNNPSYNELQDAFEKLHGEAIDAFKKLAARRKVISHLEAKILELQNQLEALKLSMVEKSKDIIEDEKPSWFGYETCHIWHGEVRTLQNQIGQGSCVGSHFCG